MKILLIGEYSNVHWTLAEGLRKLGHEVTVVSNGDFWKNYPRDISVARSSGRLGGVLLAARLMAILPRLRGYDIVQLINPMFFELKAEHLFGIYHYLRRHNRKMILGGYGMDYYWVSTCCMEKPLRYSDFNIGNTLRSNNDAMKERRDWLGTSKEALNKLIANDCDHIITGLYEYHTCYVRAFAEKTSYIPFPIKCKHSSTAPDTTHTGNYSDNLVKRKLKVFIGINRSRSEYKGTDIMLRAAKAIEAKYQHDMELLVAESVPFDEYCKMMDGADAILDQLYSYTPAMNALEAMSKGIVCIGGGEEENYEILGEETLRPIVNVQPNYDSVYSELEKLVTHPERIDTLKQQSIQYISKHHDYIKVARQYEAIYKSLL